MHHYNVHNPNGSQNLGGYIVDIFDSSAQMVDCAAVDLSFEIGLSIAFVYGYKEISTGFSLGLIEACS